MCVLDSASGFTRLTSPVCFLLPEKLPHARLSRCSTPSGETHEESRASCLNRLVGVLSDPRQQQY